MKLKKKNLKYPKLRRVYIVGTDKKVAITISHYQVKNKLINIISIEISISEKNVILFMGEVLDCFAGNFVAINSGNKKKINNHFHYQDY